MSDPNDEELEFSFEGEQMTFSLDEEDYFGSLDPDSEEMQDTEGYNCSRCGEFYRYARANQPDGTFKCWGCRH